MAANMGLIAKKCFPNATRVTDRFHERIALEALQEIRLNTAGKPLIRKMKL
jgi:hypothetical protein